MVRNTLKLILIIFLISGFVLVQSCNLNVQGKLSNNEDVKFYVLASNMLEKSAELREVNLQGELIYKTKLKLQNLLSYDFNEKFFIAGGHRANNQLIVDFNGNYKIFYLLDNPNYSGVNAINIHNDQIIAVMNGNLEETTYKNLFVVQDLENQVLNTTILDIFTSAMYSEDKSVYVAGVHISLDEEEGWRSKLIKVDLNEYQVEEKIYDKEKHYKKILNVGDKLFCLAHSITDDSSSIDVIDKNTLERIGSFSFKNLVSAIFKLDNKIYVILDNELFELTDGSFKETRYTLPEKTFVLNYFSDNRSVYLYCNNEKIHQKDNRYHMGYVIKYEKKDTGVVETKIKF